MKKIVLAIMLIGIFFGTTNAQPLGEPPTYTPLCTYDDTANPLTTSIAKPINGTFDNSVEIAWATNYDKTECFTSADIYYDTDNISWGETKINTIEISGKTFTWNTTSIPNGTYYIKIDAKVESTQIVNQYSPAANDYASEIIGTSPAKTQSVYSNSITIQHPVAKISPIEPPAAQPDNIPTLINLHLFVTNKITGKTITETKNISAKLYKSATESIWNDTFTNNQIVNGNTNILLGSGTKSLAADFSKPIWVELTIGTETLSPKFLLTPTAYAINSGQAISAKTSDYAKEAGSAKTANIANATSLSGIGMFWSTKDPTKLCYYKNIEKLENATCEAGTVNFTQTLDDFACSIADKDDDKTVTEAEALAFCQKQIKCYSTIAAQTVKFDKLKNYLCAQTNTGFNISKSFISCELSANKTYQTGTEMYCAGFTKQ